MIKTHLIFLYGNDQYSEVVLTGSVEVSPLVEVNGQQFALYASYPRLDDCKIENLYRPVAAHVQSGSVAVDS